MKHIGFSELTKRFYFLPAKGSKIDITDDIKEIINAHQPPDKFHSTERVMEEIGKGWDASVARHKHENEKYPDAYNFLVNDKITPDKETYLNNRKKELENANQKTVTKDQGSGK